MGGFYGLVISRAWDAAYCVRAAPDRAKEKGLRLYFILELLH